MLSVCLLGGCSNSELPPVINNEDIPVQSISFDLLDDKVYVNHYGKIQNFTIYPNNASNKDVRWYLEDSSLGEIVDDKIYAKAVGTTNVICEALDGSSVSYKEAIEFIPLLAPTSLEVESDVITTIGCTYTPDVKFYPYTTTTDQRYKLTIPAQYQEYAAIVDDNKVLGLKAGEVSVKVTSLVNESTYKFIDILFEDDLIAASNVLVGYNATKYKHYEDRTSVIVYDKEFDKGQMWPEFKIKLPYGVNLLNGKISFDLKWLSGSSWGCIKFLDENQNSIVKAANNRDYEIGFNCDATNEWKTFTFNLDSRFTREVHYIKFHVYSAKYDFDGNGDIVRTHPGDKVSFVYDNLAVYQG
jgi:hypothetical protein